MSDKSNTICKSVFKNGTPSKTQFTKQWIELINLLEKNKSSKQGDKQ